MVGALGDGIVLRCDIDGYQGGKGNLTNGKGGGNGGDDQGGKGGGNGGGKGKGGSGVQQATSRLQAIYLPEVPVGRFNSQVRVNGSKCNNGSRSIQSLTDVCFLHVDPNHKVSYCHARQRICCLAPSTRRLQRLRW